MRHDFDLFSGFYLIDNPECLDFLFLNVLVRENVYVDTIVKTDDYDIKGREQL